MPAERLEPRLQRLLVRAGDRDRFGNDAVRGRNRDDGVVIDLMLERLEHVPLECEHVAQIGGDGGCRVGHRSSSCGRCRGVESGRHVLPADGMRETISTSCVRTQNIVVEASAEVHT